MMTEFDFFTERVDRWTKNLSTLWGNINICPHLNCLELPCHSPAELISISSFKVWGNIQSPHHDMAYILVHLGNTTEERQYGVSLIWVNPHQTRTSTMEEAVEKLAACLSSGTDWLMSWHSCMRVPVMCHSPRVNTWTSCLKERWREPPVGRSAN